MIFVGVDPGLTGAIAAIQWDIGEGDEAMSNVWDMPTVEFSRGKSTKKKKKRVDGAQVSNILTEIEKIDSDLEVIIEDVWAMPGQGVTSVFGFGDSFGCVRGVVEAMGYRVKLVPASKWKFAMGLSSDKEESLEAAREAFPARADSLKRKKDHGRAEALMLALYGVQQSGLLELI